MILALCRVAVAPPMLRPTAYNLPSYNKNIPNPSVELIFFNDECLAYNNIFNGWYSIGDDDAYWPSDNNPCPHPYTLPFDKAKEKSLPAVIWVTFWILTLTGLDYDFYDPVPNGFLVPNNVHPNNPDLPPYPHAYTYPDYVNAKVCLYPHANCLILSFNYTRTGVYASDYEPLPNLPFLPYPTVNKCEVNVVNAKWYGPEAIFVTLSNPYTRPGL